METYLENYCKFIENCNKSLTLKESQNYISITDFNVDHIVKFLANHINIQNIFNLVNNRKFYLNHNSIEKYDLLLKFFSIFHNYAKNLIFNFHMYSNKSIQESNENIKDCLIYIPNYKEYISNLLGYDFDYDVKEWFFTKKNTEENKLRLAAVCILCANCHQILTDKKNEDAFVEENGEYFSESFDDNESVQNKTWICENCTFANNETDLNCLVCYHSHNEIINKKTILSKPISKLDPNKWECTACSLINEEENINCTACDKTRSTCLLNNNKQIINSDPINTKTLKKQRTDNVLEPIHSINRSNCAYATLDQVHLTKISRNKSENNLLMTKPNMWACHVCTFMNDKNFLACKMCGKERKSNSIRSRRLMEHSSSVRNINREREIPNQYLSTRNIEVKNTSKIPNTSQKNNLNEDVISDRLKPLTDSTNTNVRTVSKMQKIHQKDDIKVIDQRERNNPTNTNVKTSSKIQITPQKNNINIIEARKQNNNNNNQLSHSTNTSIVTSSKSLKSAQTNQKNDDDRKDKHNPSNDPTNIRVNNKKSPENIISKNYFNRPPNKTKDNRTDVGLSMEVEDRKDEGNNCKCQSKPDKKLKKCPNCNRKYKKKEPNFFKVLFCGLWK